MKRLFNILVFLFLVSFVFAQDETKVIDSLENVMAKQEGREKVLTMIELSYAFFDFSFDDCVSWGEKAIQHALKMDDVELEADANYALGINYGYHSDLDLAQIYLKNSLDLFQQSGNEEKAFESLWNQAYFELLLGNVDTAYVAFQRALVVAEQRHDSLACAQVIDNLAFIQYQRNDFDEAIKAYESSRALYALLDDTLAVVYANMNLAIILSESGRMDESRELFTEVIPQLEAFQEMDMLLTAYKNYGLLFERDCINYDSASYYFEKALACTESEILSRADRQTMNLSKADLFVEMGNVAASLDEIQQAVSYYEQAMALAEDCGYHSGQMRAAIGLGQLYAKLGQAEQSLHYFDIYSAKAARYGITMMEPAIRKYLVLDYARLGRFAEMESVIDDLNEQRAIFSRENYDLIEQNHDLEQYASGLLEQYESKIQQLNKTHNKMVHYRLAFFGLLAIVLFALGLLMAYKIVRKKRAKIK
jgi:tetratricopeptide (TPR) repeat protein